MNFKDSTLPYLAAKCNAIAPFRSFSFTTCNHPGSGKRLIMVLIDSTLPDLAARCTRVTPYHLAPTSFKPFLHQRKTFKFITLPHLAPECNCLLHRLNAMISSHFILDEYDETQFIQCMCLASLTQCHQTLQVQETITLHDATLRWWCEKNRGTAHPTVELLLFRNWV